MPEAVGGFAPLYQALPMLRPQSGAGPAVRIEGVPGVTSPDDAGSVSALARRYAANEGHIDGMLDRDVTPEQRQHIQRDLGVLPPDLLAAAQADGTRIWVASQGQTEVPGRLFPTDTRSTAAVAATFDREHASMAGYQRSLDHVNRVLDNDDRFQADFAALQANPAARDAEPNPFDALREQAMARNHLQTPVRPQTPNIDGPHIVGPRGGEAASAPGGYPPRAPQAGDTLTDMARAHGAGTPEQIAEFTALAGRLNRQGRTNMPANAPFAEGQQVEMPNVFYYQGNRVTGDTRRQIEDVNGGLRDPKVKGSYHYENKLIMVRENVLPDPAPDSMGPHRTITHEFGHVADHLMHDNPSLGSQHDAQLTLADNQSALRLNDGADKAFITNYGMTNMREHYADAFEAWYTEGRDDGVHVPNIGNDGNHRDLQLYDPGMFKLMEREMTQWEQHRAR